MSTEIFHSNSDNHQRPDAYAHFSPIHLYLIASLPLTFAAVIIWAALHWLEEHKEKLKAQARRAESLLTV